MQENITISKEDHERYCSNFELLLRILEDHPGMLQAYAEECPELVDATGFEVFPRLFQNEGGESPQENEGKTS